MEFLYFLEGIRNPVFDFIFSLITHLGEETLFLVLAIFVFWCVDKRGGYYVLMTGLIGTVVNQWLKLAFRIHRPELFCGRERNSRGYGLFLPVRPYAEYSRHLRLDLRLL